MHYLRAVSKRISVTIPSLSQLDLLELARDFKYTTLLSSHEMPHYPHGDYDALMAFGALEVLQCSAGKALAQLQDFVDRTKDWLFGCLAYDLKNEVEKLSSENPDHLGFPEMHFFQPTVVIEIKSEQVLIHSSGISPENIFQTICDFKIKNTQKPSCIPDLQTRMSKSTYIDTVDQIKNHILEGDVYEMNFCQEFFIENAVLDPFFVFNKLNEISRAPFSCFYKLKNRFLICASPERYMKKIGNTLISQPIKGTIKRGADQAEDELLKEQLYHSEKDRAENVMIVDLVRNDFARVCKAGSVQVKELFGIYPFEQVFQMISTIEGELKKEIHLVDAIKNTFPMGSMTGAPKVMAMQLIEKYEQSKRGLYSGAVGYITPDGNFDFNVVIRSMLYNQSNEYLSFQVGGAIVYDSVPELEYEECLLKAKGILAVLQSLR